MSRATTTTYQTNYGRVTLYNNDMFINGSFSRGEYWDEKNLQNLRHYIDPAKNILEFGGHCGTSTLVYASFLSNSPDSKVYVLEPQRQLYSLLKRNVEQNSLDDRISHYNKGVFCYSGPGKMHNIDIDGAGGHVEKRYHDEADKLCNFGGIGLGSEGETIQMTTIDDMHIPNLGFIHSDAQGSEPFIFWAAQKTLREHRPVILYEDKDHYGDYLYKQVVKSYPDYTEASTFDVKEFCMKELGYRKIVERFEGGIDNLLLP